MNTGLIIGTHGSPAYIDLQLKIRQLCYPNIPTIVIDDFSSEQTSLKAVCDRYSVPFISNKKRYGHSCGDINLYVKGLNWAIDNKISLMVKLSRRFCVFYDWSEDFESLALKTQGPTYSNIRKRFGFGFRTECIGFHVPSWKDKIKDLENLSKIPDLGCVEFHVHKLAQEVHLEGSKAYLDYHDNERKPQPEHSGYVLWNVTKQELNDENCLTLWHDFNTDSDYFNLAKSLGLNWSLQDFKI